MSTTIYTYYKDECIAGNSEQTNKETMLNSKTKKYTFFQAGEFLDCPRINYKNTF